MLRTFADALLASAFFMPIPPQSYKNFVDIKPGCSFRLHKFTAIITRVELPNNTIELSVKLSLSSDYATIAYPITVISNVFFYEQEALIGLRKHGQEFL